MVEFPKISIKMKNCKTFYEGQTASSFKGIIQFLPHPYPQPEQKAVSETKNFLRRYTEICRHLLSIRFNNAVLWRKERMQH